MDPTTKKHSSSSSSSSSSIPTITKHQQHPKPILSSALYKLKPHFPKFNFFNSTHIPTPSSSLKSPYLPSRVDTHLQAKSLTLSANADSSYLLNKPHSHQIRHHQQKHPMEQKNEEKIKPRKRENRAEPIDLNLSSVSLNGGRRKSWSDSKKIELDVFFFNLSARVVSVDMPPFMQIHAVSCARKEYDSLEKPSSIASTLKKEFDGAYGSAWHCIVGTSFGSFVTHSVNGFFYFSLDHKLYILLFKTNVKRAAD